MNNIKKLTTCGILASLMLILGYIERTIPIFITLPGIRLGLGNVAVLLAIYMINPKWALMLAFVKVSVGGILFSNGAGIVYSAIGSLLAYLLMYFTYKTGLFSVVGVSVSGAIGHNIGQILAACFIMSNSAILYYLPILLLAGLISGTIIGFLSLIVIKRIII